MWYSGVDFEHRTTQCDFVCLFSSGKRSKIYYREMNFDEVARLRKIIQHEPYSNHDKIVFQTFWKCSKNDWIMILNNFWTSQRSMRTFVHPQFLQNGKMQFCALRMAHFQKIWNSIVTQFWCKTARSPESSTPPQRQEGSCWENNVSIGFVYIWPLFDPSKCSLQR